MKHVFEYCTSTNPIKLNSVLTFHGKTKRKVYRLSQPGFDWIGTCIKNINTGPEIDNLSHKPYSPAVGYTWLGDRELASPADEEFHLHSENLFYCKIIKDFPPKFHYYKQLGA